MRALILSDIHSNLEALAAVLAHAEDRGGFDEVWCLGDFVGYGPDPGPCLERVGGYELVAVAGNHDYGAVAKASIDDFNDAAQAAIHWTAGQLSKAQAKFLAGLPTVAAAGHFTLVHGSLRDPLFEYLLDQESALATLRLLATPFCLVGHSHLPFICRENGGAPLFYEFTEGEVFHLGEERLIINPGCVGQPRDRDTRTGYAIYDSRPGTVQRHRVVYDVHQTQEKMRQARLPKYLVERLAQGV